MISHAFRSVRRAASDLATLFWPGPCWLCERDLDERQTAGVCPLCWSDLPCARATGEPDQPVAPFAYREPVVTLHRRAKFEADTRLVRPLAMRMAAAWQLQSRPVDLVVPVPTDPLRLLPRRPIVRGLARAVARELMRPCRPAALKKVETSPRQTSSSARERRQALHGCFRARSDLVAGKTVLLIDDISTTGATLREGGRTLREAGARDVRTLVLAQTPPPLAHARRPG